MLDFIKDFGSLITGIVLAFFTLLWKIFCVVKQGELLNQRLESLEKQFEKLDEKLDKVLDDRRAYSK
jgi:hypothetical protein